MTNFNQNNNIAIEKLNTECLKLQLESDLLIDNLILNKEGLSVSDLEEGFNKSIETFQRTIDIMNNIFKADINNTYTLEYKSYFETIVNRKNQIIQLKSKILSEKFQLSQCKTIMTLSECVLYRWQEDIGTSNNNNDNNNIIDSIEKEIIGNGSIQLIKAYDRLYWLVVDVLGVGEVLNKQVQFNITPDTPILVSDRGHYIIQVQNDFYGILFPPNIPTIYIDVFEKQLSLISKFVYLKPIETITTISTDNLVKKSFSVTSLETLTKGIESGSESISNLILTTSAIISVSLRGGGMYLQSNLEKNIEPVQVSPFVSKSISVVKTITPYAVSSSTFIMDSLSGIVEGVGSTVINGVKLIIPNEKSNENSEEKNETLEAASQFGKSSIKAIGGIIGAISNGIGQIYEEASGTTVDIVNHKYGKHVAEVTNQSLSIGKDVVDTALTLGTTKQIAFKVVKNGSVKIVEKSFSNDQNNMKQLKEKGNEEELEMKTLKDKEVEKISILDQ